jgi:16S rRNA (adenine1518-N6/adenine1519-N6)-dimethyltransferase
MKKYKKNEVTPKKHLGQHFLTDLSIAERIADSLTFHQGYKHVLEIGPGTGALTDFLLPRTTKLTAIELDKESVPFLNEKYKDVSHLTVIEGDFLQTDLQEIELNQLGVTGNFPYNISSQIFFHILDFKDKVPEVVCMLQKEVAERLVGQKDNGVLTIFLHVWYNVEYLFTVPQYVFNPPPKVMSAVVRVKRNDRQTFDCDEKQFRNVVKTAFQNRRKTLRNNLKGLNLSAEFLADSFFNKRAEELSVDEFMELTNQIAKEKSNS